MRGHLISIRIQRMRYVATDMVTTAIAFFIFNIFRYFMMDVGTYAGLTLGEFLAMPIVITEQILIPICLLAVYWFTGYYNQPFNKSRLDELLTTMVGALINTFLIFFALLLNDPLPRRTISYELIGVLWGCLFLLTYIGRLILTQITIRHLERREWCFNTVIIGNSDNAVRTASRLQNLQTKLGYHVVGHLPLPDETPSAISHTQLTDANLDRLIASRTIDQIIIIPEKGSPEEKILGILFKYFGKGIPLRIAPTSLSFLTSNIRLGDIIAEPFIDLTTPAMREWQRNVKRVIDILFSALAILLLAPVYIAVAIGVKMSSPGPIFYTQERIGYRQRPFKIYKFRSMFTDAESRGPLLSSDSDSRITPIGHTLRKYRLDEIPQFWNVLKGDMSLVGPRPEREYFIRQIVEQAPYYTLVHQVRPGITSWGMVKFGYASTVDEMVERTRYDLIYLSNMSVGVDFKIMLHTVKTILLGEGV